jgi:hypothetical protein
VSARFDAVVLLYSLSVRLSIAFRGKYLSPVMLEGLPDFVVQSCFVHFTREFDAGFAPIYPPPASLYNLTAIWAFLADHSPRAVPATSASITFFLTRSHKASSVRFELILFYRPKISSGLKNLPDPDFRMRRSKVIFVYYIRKMSLCDWFNAGVRLVLKVPFHEKEHAKQMGCRWIDKQWCYDYDMKKECINFDELIEWKWLNNIEAIHFFEIQHWFPYGAIEMPDKDKYCVNEILAKIQTGIKDYRANYDEMKQQQKDIYRERMINDYHEEECKRLCKEQGITGKEEKKHFFKNYKMERELRKRIWEIVGDPDDDEGFQKQMDLFIDFQISKFEAL